MNAIQTSIPILQPGLPKFGIFTLDPLKIVSLEIGEGSNNRPVSINLKFKDFSLAGIRSAVITNVVSDLNNYHLEIRGYLKDPVKIESDYEMKGNILFLPLVGNGKCHLTLDDVKAALILKGSPLTKDGKVYMDLKSLELKLETSRLHMNFENLLSENKEVGDNLNQFLNENWKEIFAEINPAITQALGTAFKEIATRLFNKIPYDDVFLP
ncbi:protein takeout precursor, putative [Pediculus humanus corporis]|uniref:Protein takeout, putative n=1 Tax=Pediculus humanus subsp. corporis TaxID=121224 RepID=E0W2M0_PEDHC|nr:protein takeout precursor, putative [Pediculus humanus corporis]EEB19876.1 protein takeout precursor, putative [Pediculus humanus corporis]